MTDPTIKPKHPRPGRPTDFNKAVGEKICLAIAKGEISLYKLCKSGNGFPGYSTIQRWLWDAKQGEPIELTQFRDNYARAREAQAEAYVDQIIDEIRDFSYGDDPKMANAEVQRLRVLVDTLKWAAGKQKSKFSDSYKRQIDDLLSLAGEISERLGKVKLPPAKVIPANLLPLPDGDKVKTPAVLDNDK